MGRFSSRKNLAMDLEASSGEEAREAARRWQPLWLGLAALGVVCLASAAVVSAVAPRPRGAALASPRELLESPEMVDEASRNFAAWSEGRVSADSPQLRAEVRDGLSKVVARLLADGSAEASEHLETRRLTSAQVADVLKVIGGMRHPGVQGLGRDLAKTVGASGHEDRDVLRQKLRERFQADKPALRSLHDEVFPMALRRVASDVDDASVDLDVDKTRIMREFAESRSPAPAPATPLRLRRLEDISAHPSEAGSILESDDFAHLATEFESGLSILAGLIEQCRVALDQIDFMGEAFGKDLHIPYWAKSLVGGLDFVAELSDCVMRSNDNQVKLLMCPAKYASAATDFLESVDNLLGVDNSNFFSATGSSTPVPAAQPAQNGMQFTQQGYGQPATQSGTQPGSSVWAR